MEHLLSNILEILTVLFVSSLKYIFGLVNATFFFNMGFIPSVLFTVAGGMIGFYFFAIVDKGLVSLWNRYYHKDPHRHTRHRKIKFTFFRRLMIRVKTRYGILGIAFLTPILFQVPVGTILAMRLIKDMKKVSLYMLLSFTFFSVLFCGLYYGLDQHFRPLLEHYFQR